MCDRNCLGPLDVQGRILRGEKLIFEGDFQVYVGPDAKSWIYFNLVAGDWSLINEFNSPSVDIAVNGRTTHGGHLTLNKCTFINLKNNFQAGAAKGKNSMEDVGTKVVLQGLGGLDIVFEEVTGSEELVVSYTLINWFLPRNLGAVATTSFLWNFSQSRNDQEGWADDLDSGVARYLPVSLAQAKLPNLDTLARADAEMDDLCWLASLCSGVATTWCMRQIKSGNNLLEISVFNKCPSTDAAGKIGYNVFSSLAAEYPRVFLADALPNFQRSKAELKLEKVVNYVELAREQKVVELKIATSVLCLELLTYQCCLKAGRTPENLEGKNLVNKLSDLRKYFRFIDKKFTDDVLRGGIRNPLLHTGQIPLMNFQELSDWADGLYSLTVKMLFCILGYHGKYRDNSQGNALVDAPMEKLP